MIPILQVHATQNRTRTKEEMADMLLSKVLVWSREADPTKPMLHDQAQAFQDKLRGHFTHWFKLCTEEERDACANVARDHGSEVIEAAIRERVR